MEAERLVFGSSGDGGSGSEVVFEVLSQGGYESGGTSRKTTGGVDRALEGWKDGASCLLSDLTSLASLFKRSATLSEVRSSLFSLLSPLIVIRRTRLPIRQKTCPSTLA
jgi:hypothetical protein